MTRILYVVNSPAFFLSHRVAIAIEAQRLGYEVHVATAPGPAVTDIRDHGFVHHELPLARSGQNPLSEFKLLYCLYKLFLNVKPDLIHLVTIKPVLYGGIAARLARVPSVVFAVSGLGTIFIADSLLSKLRKLIVTWLYRRALKHSKMAVIFQNPDDRDCLVDQGCISINVAYIIRGSGVELADYPFVPEPQGRPVVVLVSRLLKDKGVNEFCQAAELLLKRGVAVTMRLVGSLDPGNPTSLSKGELLNWEKSGAIEYLGYCEDIAKQYANANIACLPSYREGLPKSLIEAAACGRAVITTNVPGCRDAIEDGETGVLVKSKSSLELADAIEDLVKSDDKRRQMGEAGRKLAEQAFTIESVVEKHLCIYKAVVS